MADVGIPLSSKTAAAPAPAAPLVAHAAGAEVSPPVVGPALTAEQREDRRMHLDHLQGIIGRLSGLGFMMKGWAITLVGGVLALSGARIGGGTLSLCLCAIVIFWYLDAWLLATERRFAERYERAVARWDDDLSVSRCLREPRSLVPTDIWKAGWGFVGVCYIALAVAAGVGWLALSPSGSP